MFEHLSLVVLCCTDASWPWMTSLIEVLCTKSDAVNWERNRERKNAGCRCVLIGDGPKFVKNPPIHRFGIWRRHLLSITNAIPMQMEAYTESAARESSGSTTYWRKSGFKEIWSNGRNCAGEMPDEKCLRNGTTNWFYWSSWNISCFNIASWHSRWKLQKDYQVGRQHAD